MAKASNQSPLTRNPRADPPVAAWPHTLLLIAILLAIAASGAKFQATPTGAVAKHDVLPLYVSLLMSEALLVYAVAKGIRRTGTTLADLTGGRWLNVGGVARDVLRAAVLWAVLSVSALNTAGDSLPGAYAIDITSRNPAVVTVDLSHRIHAVNGGSTYVVGSLFFNGENLTDSLRVFVSAPVSGAK